MIKQPIQCKCAHHKLAMIDRNALHIKCRSCGWVESVTRQELIQKWADLDRVEEGNSETAKQQAQKGRHSIG